LKITDPVIVKNPIGNYYIKSELDHNELDIIVEGLTHMINAGLSDPVRREDTLKLYGELFAMWEATTFDNSKPVPVAMTKIDVVVAPVCPKNTTWDEKANDCLPNAGFYKDKDGAIVPISNNNCGANAHFDPVNGCVCDEGFERDKTGACVPIVVTPPK
jgi:hypothetical protein